MIYLVTGSSGLIASHLVEKILSEGHTVYGLDIVPSEYTTHVVDLLDKDRTASIIKDIKPEIVCGLAANAAEGRAQFSPIDITKRNVEIFLNTIVPAINSGMRRFMFTSSIAVYGAMQIPFRESDPPIPQDIYGINKLAIEQMLRVLANVHKFEYVVTRPHNVYGERQNMKDPYRNVVTIFMNHLLHNKPYSIYGDGSMKRCFSYIDDVIDVLYKTTIMPVSGVTVNVGSETLYSINKLSNTIQEVSGIEIPPLHIEERPQEVHTAKSDHSVCKVLFGYHETPLKEGIQKTWDWVKKQGAVEPEYSEPEIRANNYPSNWK